MIQRYLKNFFTFILFYESNTIYLSIEISSVFVLVLIVFIKINDQCNFTPIIVYWLLRISSLLVYPQFLHKRLNNTNDILKEAIKWTYLLIPCIYCHWNKYLQYIITKVLWRHVVNQNRIKFCPDNSIQDGLNKCPLELWCFYKGFLSSVSFR